MLPAVQSAAGLDARRGAALAAAHCRDLGAGVGPVSRTSVRGHLHRGHQPVHGGHRRRLLSGRAAELRAGRHGLPAAARRDRRLRGERPAPAAVRHRPAGGNETLPDSHRLAPAGRRHRHHRAGLAGVRRRIPDIRYCPTRHLLATRHCLVAAGRTAGPVPAHRLPEPYEAVVRAAHSNGFDCVPRHRPGVLDRGAGRGDPLDGRRERIERAGPCARRASGRNRRRIDELHDHMGRQQLLAVPHGQIGRGVSRAQRHRPDLHRTVRRSSGMDGRSGRFHPVLRGTFAVAGVLRRASGTARRVAGSRLELHRGRQRDGGRPA